LSGLNLRIRIVSGSLPTTGEIYFTDLKTSVPFSINPNEVYDYTLNTTQKGAAYNETMGITDYSIRIISYDEPVTVYAHNVFTGSGDATNVLPISALGTEYYHISYTSTTVYYASCFDAYAVIATKDNTHLYHNGTPIATLNSGQVYYRTSSTDMTGARITADNPVAFFAVHQLAVVPAGLAGESHLFQQLAPVNTCGKEFFVPVTVDQNDIVRIVVLHNGTNITQTGGIVRTGVSGAQTILTNLQAGDFVELDNLNNGCHIITNHPVEVCAYMTERNLITDYLPMPAQCWVPGIEQTVSKALIAPFKVPAPASGILGINYALVVKMKNVRY
jgi:hypothetical protein